MPSPSKQAKFPVPQNVIELNKQEPFGKGGNRLCFVHPDDPSCCLKILQEHATPTKRRVKKRWLGRLRPLSSFDENLQELRALELCHERFAPSVLRHLPRSRGLFETDYGTAHGVDLIRDEDGRISQTMEQYVWENGLDSLMVEAINRIRQDWKHDIPSTRDLLPHNLLIKRVMGESSLILIDGYGRPKRFFSAFKDSPAVAFEKLSDRIATILDRKSRRETPKLRITQLNRTR